MKKIPLIKTRKELKGIENQTADQAPDNTQKNFIDRYSELETKGNVSNSLLKSVTEFTTSAIGGTYLSALLGTKTPIVSAIITFFAHYMGDKTGLLKTLATSALAHSVAKSKEYRQDDSTLKVRISGVKDDLLYAFMLKKYHPEEHLNGLDAEKYLEINDGLNKKNLYLEQQNKELHELVKYYQNNVTGSTENSQSTYPNNDLSGNNSRTTNYQDGFSESELNEWAMYYDIHPMDLGLIFNNVFDVPKDSNESEDY